MYRSFLEQQSKAYKKVLLTAQAVTYFAQVFVIAGNHEFYSTTKYKPTKDQVIVHMKEVCAQFENVVALDRDTHFVGNYRIIGATLWEPPSPFVNDMSKIYVEEKTLLTANVQSKW